MLSLTWAFQYAGARSVVASLWEVGDASTAELMRRFYGHLGQGLSKAEALRRAQVALLMRGPTTAPYFWAAFQLVGDWR
jgi:CHAT domain-containing protein